MHMTCKPKAVAFFQIAPCVLLYLPWVDLKKLEQLTI